MNDLNNKYQYDLEKDLLGEGGFGVVYRAIDKKLDVPVALKFFQNSQAIENKYDFKAELNRNMKLRHDNIIGFLGLESLKTKDIQGKDIEVMVGVLEYCNAGTLIEYCERKKPNQRILGKIIKDILRGLGYLHKKKIIHRDIKPENIYINEEDGEVSAKIGDFGISKQLRSNTTKSSELVGTFEYMAPEQFVPEQFAIDHKKINYNLDLWALGAVLLYLFSNKHPFGTRSEKVTEAVIITKIISEEPEIDLKKIPSKFQKLVTSCLVKDASERLQTAEDGIVLITGKMSSSATTEIINEKQESIGTTVKKRVQKTTAKLPSKKKALTKPKKLKVKPKVERYEEVERYEVGDGCIVAWFGLLFGLFKFSAMVLLGVSLVGVTIYAAVVFFLFLLQWVFF